MRVLYLVYQEHGGPWDWSKGLREQTLFEEHARFMNDLVEKNVVVLGGPLDDKDVLLVVDAASPEDVRAHFAHDPWIENGMLTITTIRPWSVLLDSTTQVRNCPTVRSDRREATRTSEAPQVVLNVVSA